MSWNDWSKAETTGTMTSGDETSKMYDIGKWSVKISHDGEVSYRDRNSLSDEERRRNLPGLVVIDDEIRIPLEDFANIFFQKAEPQILAQMLWEKSEDVKHAFIECFSEMYHSDGFTDHDRRQFLDRIQETIYSQKIDNVTRALSEREFDFIKVANYHAEIQGINRILRERNVMVTKLIKSKTGEGYTEVQVPLQFNERNSGPVEQASLSIGGKAWSEARAWWRNKLMELAPPPKPNEK